MEFGQYPCSHAEEIRGMNFSTRYEEIESNGHRGYFEPMELSQTMRSLKVEVQSCKVDNDHENHNELNTQLMQTFNQLQKKIKDVLDSKRQEEDMEHQKRMT